MDLFDIEAAAKESDKAVKEARKKKDFLDRIKELEKLIVRYQDSYYNGESEISDAEFDKLWDELKSLDPSNPILHKVGADSGNFAKVPHIMPMGSQEKAATPEEFKEWATKHSYGEYLIEYKLDGASLELQYNGGKLLRAVTRGDGVMGDVITDNAVKMHGVVKELSVDFTGGIRGEVIMTHQVHKELYSDKANCRNAANGLMKRKDGEGSENLNLIVYDVWATDGEQPFKDEEGKLQFLRDNGFDVVPLEIVNTADEVIGYREKVMEKRKNLDYDIDGLVIKERAVDHEDASRDRPERQIAFKFSLEEAVSVLREVEWGETGATYTPVAIFDPVELNGTTVKRASLVNTNLINSLELKIGSHVVVVKRGEIIPKIISVVPALSNEKLEDIKIPNRCNTCGTELVDEGTRLYCPNRNCGKKVLHQLLKWVSVVDIRDLGETLVTELFNSGKVRSISDIYRLTVEDLTPYFLDEESLKAGKKSLGAEKVFASIQSHRKVSLAKFIAGFDIEGIGETVVETLMQSGYSTLDKMISASEPEIASVYRFAEILAHTFVSGIQDNKDEMLSLVEDGVINLVQGENAGNLSGLSFCFTGELKSLKRADAQNLVKEKGGSVKSSVVKGLSYLVTNDTTSGSSKNKKAAELGVPIINEEEFLKLVQ
ncbi:NAD-dependent DNA ligase LigA [Treponema sp.]|uniref:NAD-dependent DNA ligase LigA n=1 Tax=Treponema sp. TaxID=166 RepID=UPI00388D8DB5